MLENSTNLSALSFEVTTAVVRFLQLHIAIAMSADGAYFRIFKSHTHCYLLTMTHRYADLWLIGQRTSGLSMYTHPNVDLPDFNAICQQRSHCCVVRNIL